MTEATAFILTPEGFQEYYEDHFNPPAWLITCNTPFSMDGVALLPETRFLLPIAAELLNRIIPGTRCAIFPSLPVASDDADKLYAGTGNATRGGVAVVKHNAILVSTEFNAWAFIETILHEVWHIVENRLSRRDWAIVRTYIRAGIPMPNDYYGQPRERTARAFAAWGQLQLSRSTTPPPIPSGRRTVEQIYSEVFAGCYKPSSDVVVVESQPHPGFIMTLFAAYAGDARFACTWLATSFRRLGGKTTTRRTTL